MADDDDKDKGGSDLQKKVDELQSALDKTKSQLSEAQTKHRNATEKLKAYEDDEGNLIDAKAAKDALGKVGEMANWKPEDKVKEQLEARERQLTEKHQAELKRATDRQETLSQALHKSLIRTRALQAIRSAEADEVLLPHVEGMLQVVEEDGEFDARVVDEKGNHVLSKKAGENGPMGIDELVNTVMRERYPRAFPGTDASGAGTDRSKRIAGGAGSGGKDFTISEEDARDSLKYQKAREAAEKAGAELQIVSESA